MIWVIASNSNICRIYQFDKHAPKLSLLKEINHPEGRLKNSEFLTSDKPGRYKNDNSAGGAYSPHTEPKEVEVDNFAREIANELNKGRNDHAYNKLIIISSPHTYGLLVKNLDKHVKDLIINDIQKDIMSLSEHDLLNFIVEHLP